MSLGSKKDSERIAREQVKTPLEAGLELYAEFLQEANGLLQKVGKNTGRLEAESLKQLSIYLNGNFSIGLRYGVEFDDSGIVSILNQKGNEEYRIERGSEGGTFLKNCRHPQKEPVELEPPYSLPEILETLAEWEVDGGEYMSIEHRDDLQSVQTDRGEYFIRSDYAVPLDEMI